MPRYADNQVNETMPAPSIHMLTIFEALTWADNKLKTTLSPAQNPKIDAQALLAFVLKKGTAYLFAHGDETLSAEALALFERLVRRRERHEPVAYLTGVKEFYGRPFFVNPSTLIPRPETEMLVDLAKKYALPDTAIVDVGTGCGAIAVSVALETGLPAFAIDESIAALTVAARNVTELGARDLVTLAEGNLLEPFFDSPLISHPSPLTSLVILANLPYISERAYESLDADVKTYEPRSALVSGIDGLDHYDALLSQLAHIFQQRAGTVNRAPTATLILEIDPSQKESAPALVRHYFPHADVTVLDDAFHWARFLVTHLA